MQKLLGKTMDKLYRSCSVFHQESNKIEFEFLWFMYDFLGFLQDSAKRVHYWRFGFAPRSLGIFQLLHICPQFSQKTLERSKLMQLGPCPWGRPGSPESGGSGGVLAGEGVREEGELNGDQFIAVVWAMTPAAMRLMEGVGGGRCVWASGEAQRKAGQHGMLWAPMWPRQGVLKVSRPKEWAER
jgi:hypothetical protein